MNTKKLFTWLSVAFLGIGVFAYPMSAEELTSGVEYEVLQDGNISLYISGTDSVGEELVEKLGEELPEEITVKNSDVKDSTITGIKNGETYTVSRDTPITVTIIGANSFGSNPAQIGDTRWLFQSVSINGGSATAEWEWTGEDAPVYTIDLVPSDSIKKSGDYDITFYFIQEVLQENKWAMTEVDLGEVTFNVHLDVPGPIPTVTPVPSSAPTPTPWVGYWAGQNEIDLHITEGNSADAIVFVPVDRSLSFSIHDETVVASEEIRRYRDGERYATAVTFKGLEAGDTIVDFYDGDYKICTFEIYVTALSPSPTPSRPLKIADINDTVVSGLTNLKLMPNTFYPFTVTGAGMDNNDPIAGDIRWMPVYWRMEGGTLNQSNWKIGASAGINEERTIPIRIYLQEQRYDGTEWKATGVTDYITANVTTITYTQRDINGELPMPGIIAAYNGAKGIGIKFYKVDEATHYVIYRKFDGIWYYVCTVSADDPDLQISGNTIMYTDISVAKNYGKGYIYSVAARNGSEVSGFDQRGAAIYRLNPPKLTKIINSESGAATVSWSGVFGKTETNGAYDLQYTEYKDGKAGTFKSVTARPGFNHQTFGTTVIDLKKGCRYVFRIRCSKTNKDRGTYYSEYSPWLSVTIGK